ncbi:MAG: NAD(P)/FAD-dependent oxidoreductase [Deltaproteobacteria bacterium]
MGYLILGGGAAGIAAAGAIRKRDKSGKIVIATEETAAPYLRPLLPDLISGDADAESIKDPQGEGLAGLGIDVRKGKRAAKVDAQKNKVAFTDRSSETYQVLLVATGGKPVVPPALARAERTVIPFDSLADTVRIRERAGHPGASVVYGPGYLAMEACRVLKKAGRDVVWIKPGQPRFGNPIAGEFEASVINQIQERGVRLKDGAEVVALEESAKEAALVRTGDGESIRCAVIVVATERLPSIAFLEGSGVKVGTGVLVDDYLRTNVPNIFAAGDCAELRDAKTGKTHINFGWRSAIKQGRLAGENMAGGGKLYTGKQEDYLWLLFGAPLTDRIG